MSQNADCCGCDSLNSGDGGVKGALGSSEGLAGLLGALDADGIVQVIHLSAFHESTLFALYMLALAKE